MISNHDEKTVLIKMGGSILHHPEQLRALCADIKILSESGMNIIIVHGGSKAIHQALTIQGIHSEFLDGLRITTPQAMTIIKNVLSEQVNQTLVEQLTAMNLHAIGLCGADGQLLLCEQYSIQYGLVGHIKAVNTSILDVLYQGPVKTIPVIATIGVDEHGNLFNINADMAACHLANALSVDELLYLTDQEGIYDEKGIAYSQLSEYDLSLLIKKSIVHGGMLVKTKAILTALKSLNEIHVLNGNQAHILQDVLLNNKSLGTVCKKNEIAPLPYAIPFNFLTRSN